MTAQHVTVCAECLRASCWQGTFPCENKTPMGTVKLRVTTLQKLSLENPAYWEKPK